jgi:nucleotide-binding universal stress UspA family protein
MSFATLMVHVDVEPKSDTRVRLATQLADRFASTLIGISACILPPYPAEGAYFVTREFVDQEQQDILAALQRTEASFRAAAGEKGSRLEWLEWRSAIDPAGTAKHGVADHLIDLARVEGADLIVTGAYGHSRLGEWIFGGVTRELLASSPVCCLMSN